MARPQSWGLVTPHLWGPHYVSHQLIVARAKFQEVLEALEFVSAGQPMENEAYLSKDTGAIHWHSEHGDNFEELPSDIDEIGKYLAIPHKNDLGLGKRLALRFAEESVPGDFGTVREMFSHRGAYARFKGLLEERGMLNQWYEYEAAAQKAALLQWCEANGIEIDG